MKPNVKCDFCGKQFYKKPNQLLKFKHHYCGLACSFDAMRRSVEKGLCTLCGAEVMIDANRRRYCRSGKYFCGRKCQNEYLAKHSWKKNPDSWKRRKQEVKRRCDYKCQNVGCGYNKDQRMLDVHHVDGDETNNAWNNLTCACVWCHTLDTRGVQKIVVIKTAEGTSRMDAGARPENERAFKGPAGSNPAPSSI